MQINGPLDQERYWLFVNDRTGGYACLQHEKPHKLSVFRTERDGTAHLDVYFRLRWVRGHWASRHEVQVIAALDFDGNYAILDEADIPFLSGKIKRYRWPDFRDVADF